VLRDDSCAGERGLGGGQGGGLPRAGGAFDHDQGSVAGKDTDHGGLGGVDAYQATSSNSGAPCRHAAAGGEVVNDVGLHSEDTLRRERAYVFGNVGAGQQAENRPAYGMSSRISQAIWLLAHSLLASAASVEPS